MEISSYVRILNCDVEIDDPNGDAIKTLDVNLVGLANSTIMTRANTAVNGLRIRVKTAIVWVKNNTFQHEANDGFSILIKDGHVYVKNSEFVGDCSHDPTRAAIWYKRVTASSGISRSTRWSRCGVARW